MPRPVHLAGQRLRRRPDKCDAGCRRHKLHITRFRRCRRRKLAHSAAPPSSHRNRFLGFGGSPVGGGDKNSHFTFFSALLCGGDITTLWPLWLCRNNPARGLFRQKNGFLRVGALCRRTRCSLLHTVLFWHLYAWGGITTLGARFMPLKRWTPAGHGGVFAVFVPPQCSPCVGEAALVGYTRHPSP